MDISILSEHSPTKLPMMPRHNDPRHPVWSVHRHILAHQLLHACSLANPPMTIAVGDVDDLVDLLSRKLAQGWNQKKLRQKLTPTDCQSQHRAIFAELSRWVFATQGVLSNIYQPLLCRRSVEAGDGPLHRSPLVTGLQGHNWGTPIPQNSILLGLPNEIFDHVLQYLTSQDTNDVRLTCREARVKSFDFWSKNFFSTRQFMIDEYSLRTLVAISRHPELCSVFTHLIIGVNEINTKDTLACIHDKHATNPTRVAAMFRYWRDAAAAQQALLHTGRAAELLSEAMSNLKGLKTVSVSGSKISRYVHRWPDIIHYPDLGLRSYGSSAYQMQDRYVQDTEMPNTKGFVDRVFNCVLTSLTQASPKHVKALRTNLALNDFLPHMNDEAFNLPPFAPFYTDNYTVLANLTELYLDVSLSSRMVRKYRMLAEHEHTFDPCNASLRQLLCACNSLESLTLSICPPEFGRINQCDFAAWLGEPADCPSDTNAYWPSLRRLVIKGLKVSPANLRGIFVKFNTLTSAALKGIELRNCFVDRVPIPRDSTEKLENLWATFFRESAAVLSKLESLELESLAVDRYREGLDAVPPRAEDYSAIMFVPEPPKADDRLSSRSITVTDMREEALEALAEQTWFLSDWIRARDAAHQQEVEESGGDRPLAPIPAWGENPW